MGLFSLLEEKRDTIRISKNGLFKEHKSVMYEIRLADSPNDTCPMEYEALQEIVTFD